MINVIHIHTDLKFVVATARFKDKYFENTVIILGEKEGYTGQYCDQAIYFSNSLSDLNNIIKLCSKTDLVVLYDLDTYKSYIALNIPQYVKVIWRFFGYELYKRRNEQYLTESSQKFKKEEKSKIRLSLKRRLLDVALVIKYGSSPKELFRKAIKRIDYFLGVSQQEYHHLIEFWELPPFLQLPLNFTFTKNAHFDNSENMIIIGNSRGIYNNHIDIINLINEANLKYDLNFVVPFNYGPCNAYSNEVEKLIIKSTKRIIILKDFMSRDSYYNYISRAKSAVFNGYRQMALGNIFFLLDNGVKIYLNKRNAIYSWLMELGYKVYTIEDFSKDLSSNNIELSLADKKKNKSLLEELSLMFSDERFANEILGILPKQKVNNEVS